MVIVLYHDKCLDGTVAAYNMWTKYGNDQIYIPVNYSPLHKLDPEECLRKILDTPIDRQFTDIAKDISSLDEEDLKDYDLYIVDFCFPATHLKLFTEKFKRVTVLDHHRTALDDIGEEFELITEHDNGTKIFSLDASKSSVVVFNMNYSGAELSWMYVKNSLGDMDPRETMGELTLFVGDRDLWNFSYPETKDFTSGLHFLDYKSFRDVHYDLDVTKCIKLGNIVNRKRQTLIEDMVRSSLMDIDIRMDGETYKGALLNNTDASLVSDGSEHLRSLGYDIVISYGINKKGEVGISLRSRKGVDCSKVARMYSGGGHQQASGGRMTREELMDIISTSLIEVN